METTEKLGKGLRKLMGEEIKRDFKGSRDLFITSFTNLVVPEQDNLRSSLQKVDASVFVVKNRIARYSFEHLDLNEVSSLMKGMTAVVATGNDVVGASKVIMEFAGSHESFKIMGGYIDGQLLDTGDVKQLASIPSRGVLLAQVFAGFRSPIQGLVNSLSATLKKFVVVIDKIQEQKAKSEKQVLEEVVK